MPDLRPLEGGAAGSKGGTADHRSTGRVADKQPGRARREEEQR